MWLDRVAHAVWNEESVAARTAAQLLQPAAWLYGRVVSRRNAQFDAAPSRRAALPAISVGNLTVGGTGKTPFAAWCVSQLRSRGARPAIVMRGVGDDEWKVHGVLNPGVPVVVTPDRSAGMITARARGADCAVLDDGFQHRRAPRTVDLVLMAADQWRGHARLLPAGPFREPLSSLRRADAVVITAKAAGASVVGELTVAIQQAAPDTPVVTVRLVPGTLHLAASLLVDAGAGSSRNATRSAMLDRAPSWLAGRNLVAASAIGNPLAYESQLRELGAGLKTIRRFPDHHTFTVGDAADIAAAAEGTDGAVCTLKDAVKLAVVWPRAGPPLWYLSQSVVVDRGAEVLDRAFARILSALAATAPTAG
jgi:tetraacyldisaccharide 4'-kinase